LIETNGDVSTRRYTSVVVLLVMDAIVIVTMHPSPAAARAVLTHPRGWARGGEFDKVVLVLAADVLWLVAVWLAVALLVASMNVLPGAAGRLAHIVSARLLPPLLFRALVGATGASIALTSTAAASAAPPSAAAVRAAAVVAHPGDIVVGWPDDHVTAVAEPHSTPPSVPIQAPGNTQAHVRARPDAPGPRSDREQQVTVRSGDSLWAIAARRLRQDAAPDEIARSWPAWYSKNRSVIGANPDVIQAGSVLVAPDDKEWHDNSDRA
jgi:hypothetical protein